MSFFSQAFADAVSEVDTDVVSGQEEAPTEAFSSLMSFLPLIVIFIIFYFLIIRPQQKKVKEHGRMVDSVKRGDKVVTVGGMIGIVTKVDVKTSSLTLEVSENTEIKVLRSSVAEIMNRSRPNKDAQK